ncbi:MAG: IS5/IS1182 family transposase, partial [Synechococcus sp.]
MNNESTQQLSPQQFKRRFGVRRSTFEQVLKALQKQLPPNPGRGRKPKLCLEERVMVSLEYWREYRTYFH